LAIKKGLFILMSQMLKTIICKLNSMASIYCVLGVDKN